ncbi:hypothetical protein J3F84DRAFT_67878 [Trichoderma pleuroticola]
MPEPFLSRWMEQPVLSWGSGSVLRCVLRLSAGDLRDAAYFLLLIFMILVDHVSELRCRDCWVFEALSFLVLTYAGSCHSFCVFAINVHYYYYVAGLRSLHDDADLVLRLGRRMNVCNVKSRFVSQ